MNNQENSQKKPIAPILKTMEIGENEEFPIEFLSTVRVTKDRIQRERRRRFSLKTTPDFVTVTRTK